jgi:hypothetical protein
MAGPVDDRLAGLVQAEFCEMPGLRLTHTQAERLWSLDEDTCTHLLDYLVRTGFLVSLADGRYARVGDGELG